MIKKITLGASLLALAICVAPMAFAQSDATGTSNGVSTSSEGSPSASSSMKRAGHSTENAVSNAYHGTKRAVEDTAVTTRVKLALHDDKVTHGTDIHVDTIGGVVTLSGSAPSNEAAERAVSLARHTKGVESVKNAITIAPEKNSMR